MKNILFLTHQLPYPAVSGGLFKTYKLVEFLSGFNQLTLMITDGQTSLDNIDQFTRLTSVKEFKHFPITRKRNPINYFKSLIKRIPLSVYRNFSYEMKDEIEKRIDEFDIIFVDHFLMFQHVPDHYKGKVILHQHNAEYVLWQRFSEVTRNPLIKILTRFESKRIAAYEKMICDTAMLILSSPNDQIELMKLGIEYKKFVHTLHLGDTDLLHKLPLSFCQTKKKLLYIGTLTWAANIDGLKWFLETVWPMICLNDSEVELSIVGKCTDGAIFQNWKDHPQIKWLGFVKNLDNLYDDSRVFIAPLRFGSGIKVKVVNSLYRGLPVVTTPIGVEGLEIVDGKHLLISKDEKQMAENILNLLSNNQCWSKISKESRDFSRENLSWEKTLDPLRGVIGGDKWQRSQD